MWNSDSTPNTRVPGQGEKAVIIRFDASASSHLNEEGDVLGLPLP